MFDMAKEKIKRDQLANDLIELGHQLKKTNQEVSVKMSSTVGIAATKALTLVKRIEAHISDIAKSYLNGMPDPTPNEQEKGSSTEAEKVDDGITEV